MDDHNTTPWSRRLFLQQGATLASLVATTPLFIEQTARGMMLPLGSLVTSQAGVPEDRVFVVVQLGGGNDGLNSVVPYGSSEYYNLRSGLAIQAPGRGDDAALELDGVKGIGLHPSLRGLKELMDEGSAGIVQGVGYPNPNRSHFSSMDIWHSADTNGKSEGWLGRYFDNTCNGTPNPEAGIAIGRQAPLAMQGRTQMPVSFERSELFRWMGTDLDQNLEPPYETIAKTPHAGMVPEEDSQAAFLKRTTLDARISSDRVRKAVAASPMVTYPNSNLSNQLRMVAAMIRAELRTRVYYVTLSGFDTHANQAGQHARLLEQVGDALLAFQRDIQAQDASSPWSSPNSAVELLRTDRVARITEQLRRPTSSATWCNQVSMEPILPCRNSTRAISSIRSTSVRSTPRYLKTGWVQTRARSSREGGKRSR